MTKQIDLNIIDVRKPLGRFGGIDLRLLNGNKGSLSDKFTTIDKSILKEFYVDRKILYENDRFCKS